ncbi:MAG: carboxypeptidase regulatory-like domain-containing protein [Gemmatimonadaceae bacterium]
MSRPSRIARALLLGILPALALLASNSSGLSAQGATASIVGEVRNRDTRAPIAGATVMMLGLRPLTTDSAGSFAFSKLRAGSHLVEVRAIGYVRVSGLLDVEDGKVVRPVIEMEATVAELPGVVVEAAKSQGRRFAEFERRRAQGRGSFFTQEEIEARNPMNLADLLRTVRGVRTECSGTQCQIRMARSARGCDVQYYVDGRLSNTFGPSTPMRDVEGIEIYHGQSETPAEFMGFAAGCGVIAIWTRSAP